MAGSITQDDREFVEEWEHISPQQWGIIRFDARGDEKPEIIGGRRRFRITTEERMVTEDRIKDEAHDPFLNGSFRPVIVPDSITIETNPNALSDEDILEIFAASDIAFAENLESINSVSTYKRMLELAETHDDLTVKRLRMLEERYLGVRETVRIETKDPRLRKFLKGGPSGADAVDDDGDHAVASGADNPRRRQPGMSSNYR